MKEASSETVHQLYPLALICEMKYTEKEMHLKSSF